MSTTESLQVTNKAAGTYPVVVNMGGFYQLAAKATWGGGSLKLQQIMPDPAATAVDLFGQPSSATPNTWVASLTADGVLFYYLPPGSYNLVFATGTALYASLTRVPLD